MAMIRCESLEMAAPEGGMPIPGSSLLQSTNYPTTGCSSNNIISAALRNICTEDRNPTRDSGVDVSEGLHEVPREDGGFGSMNDSLGFSTPPLPGGGNVSEHFCSNPIIRSSREVHRRDSGECSSMDAQVSMGTDSQISPIISEASNRSFSYSMESENVTSMKTCSTIVEEESYIPVSPSAENAHFSESSDIFHPPDDSGVDDRPFQPDEDDTPFQPDEEECELSSTGMDMKYSKISIDNADEVQIGPKVNITLPSPVTKVAPGINVAANKESQKKNFVSQQSQESHQVVDSSGNSTVHININTPPVQNVPLRFPVGKTMSTPVGSLSSGNGSSLHHHPPLTLPLGARLPQDNRFGNMTMPPSSPSPGTFNISGANSIVLGTQIIVNSPQGAQRDNLPTLGNPRNTMDKVLKEAQEKLVHNYKYQTKRSLLPWLKGRQVIPMTDFYTESRIFAVDKHGKQTRQTVNLVDTLVLDDEARFIVEGEPGMGKTLLACKLAIDWANEKSLQKFKFVFLIFLRDYKDSLEGHVKEELLSSLSEEKFKEVWEYCKNNEEKVLFILDGYDELEKSDETKIQRLIEGKDFQRSKVVVTSRPDVLITVAKRIIVKGFSEAQMLEFIGKYFKLVSENSVGRDMRKIIEKDYKYRKLAKRPLFCVLLCMLYGSEVVSKLPERLSDLMFKIMLCLIKWNNKKVGNVDENTEAFPPEYEELFLQFGKLCLQALKTDKTRFSEKEILDLRGMFDSTLLLQLGFLSNDSENYVLGPKKFWKPVHKIFLEYLAGLYIANHCRDCRDCKECKEFSSIYRHEHVLQFVFGTLDKRAHLVLEGRRHQVFHRMKDSDLLMLLREAGPTKDNCRAVAKLLDNNFATVYTSEVDFEGWGSILAQKFSKLKSLEIVWRIKSSNPDQESSFTEASPELYDAFFSALKSNTSVNKIKIRATQDGEPFSEEKIELFFSNLEKVLLKENLRELEIKELKMHVSSHLRRAIEGATCHMDKKPLSDLEILRLDMFMDDEDLYVLCDRLRKCAPNLKELQLTGLVIGSRGFTSLVELIKKSKNLQKLHISMDKAHLQSNKGVFLSQQNNDYSPSVMYTDQKRMNRQAVNESRRAYNERKFSLESGCSSQDMCCSGAAKPYTSTHRNSCVPAVSLEKVHQQLNKAEYYTDEELENVMDLDNEVNASKEQNLSSTPQQQHHRLQRDLPVHGDDYNGNPIGSLHSSRGSRSPSFSGGVDGRGRVPSPHVGEPSNSNHERTYSMVKDPTKELSYLFQDPFNTGMKPTHMANHYSFILGDGENQLPLPLCNDREHKSVFHDLFVVLPESTIKSLTLDYPCLYLSTLDLVCLGDAIRKTKSLETLVLQNLKMAKKYIPVVLGLGQCQSLTTVMLESKSVVITDASFALACIALRNNTTLKSLSLAQWEFNIQNKEMATRSFRDLLSSWKVVDLNLTNCHIDTGMALAPTLITLPILLPIQGPTHNWSNIKILRLPRVKLKEPMALERRGHLLLPVLRNCPNLTVLDLSASPNYITPLDDKASQRFFTLLGTSFKKLRELTLRDWEFKFKNYEETCIEIGNLVRSCTELKVLVLDQVSEVRSGLSLHIPCRTTFLHQLVNNLPRLSELSLCFYRIDACELSRDSASRLGACFHDHWNSNNKFRLKFFGLHHTVETALLETLKKDNFSVVVSQGYPLEITVKKRCFLAA